MRSRSRGSIALLASHAGDRLVAEIEVVVVGHAAALPLDHHACGVDEGARRNGEVVDDQGRAALDGTDELHDLGRL